MLPAMLPEESSGKTRRGCRRRGKEMVHIPYGKSFIEFDEQGANTLTSRIGELKAEGGGSDL